MVAVTVDLVMSASFEDDGGLDVAEAAVNFGHAHVDDAEVDFAVVGIGDPGRGLRQGERRREGQDAGENCQSFHRERSFIECRYGDGRREVARTPDLRWAAARRKSLQAPARS